MKAKILRDDLASSKHTDGVTEIRMHKGRLQPMVVKGATVDHPDAWRLVQQGIAEPADKECREKCGLTDEQIAARQQHYEAVSRGIHPQDYPAFFAGRIAGYNPDGSYIPGPNAGDEPASTKTRKAPKTS